MAIDGCSKTFKELATADFPRLMKQIRLAMRRPHPLAWFCVPGSGVHTILRQIGDKNFTSDFPGCYVILASKQPEAAVYVGISKEVIKRVRQHVMGDNHLVGSLAYRMAKGSRPHDMHRADAMADPEFRREFEKQRGRLRGMWVAFVRIENMLELHLFEAYCAMELDTRELNTFAPH
jgi:hypothetical protein